MFSGIDFFSDTVTKPTMAMKEAMMKAALGDEQKGEDPTTLALEQEMKKRLGKTAAMFFPSATMCNQIAVHLQTSPGDEVIGADSCHIFGLEAGGLAFHSRAQARTIKTIDGIFDAQDLKDNLRYGRGAHTPQCSLLLVENTTNVGGGVAWPIDKLSSVISCAKEFGLKTHLDGARLFNAAIAQKKNIKDLAQGFDTVTICFSKGLGCATGAVLGFDKELWPRVRKLKQVFGGAMRQSGILAAACLYALEHHVEALAIDHAHAQTLAKGLSSIKGIKLDNPSPSTNMLFFTLDELQMDPDGFMSLCEAKGLRFSRIDRNRFRAVTHRDIAEEQIFEAIKKLKEIF